MRPGLLDQFPYEFVSMRAAEKRVLREIDSVNLRFGKRGRKSECNHTRPGSDIQNLGLRIWNFGFEELNEFLRLRARNHRALIAKKCVAAKFHRAEQMLEWLALAAPPNQLAQRGQF